MHRRVTSGDAGSARRFGCGTALMEARALVSKIVEHASVPADEAAPLHDVRDWDSLSTLALVLELEEVLGRELTDDEVAGLHTLRDVQRLLDAG